MKQTCENCRYYKVVHDRHGFDHGPYEDNSFCVLSEDPSFDEDLDEVETRASERGELGWSVPCPKWDGGYL